MSQNSESPVCSPPSSLPLYKCHKVVGADKIEKMNGPFNGHFMLFCSSGFQAEVSTDWVSRHKPKPGGYFVEYADGYTSFSPAEAFEAGYSPFRDIPFTRAFRKKPVVIEAITFEQLVEHAKAEIAAGRGGANPEGVPYHFDYKGHPITHETDDSYAIPTLEGIMQFRRGDMLITGVKGEIYPCKSDIFAATYEAIEENEHKPTRIAHHNGASLQIRGDQTTLILTFCAPGDSSLVYDTWEGALRCYGKFFKGMTNDQAIATLRSMADQLEKEEGPDVVRNNGLYTGGSLSTPTT